MFLKNILTVISGLTSEDSKHILKTTYESLLFFLIEYNKYIQRKLAMKYIHMDDGRVVTFKTNTFVRMIFLIIINET